MYRRNVQYFFTSHYVTLLQYYLCTLLFEYRVIKHLDFVPVFFVQKTNQSCRVTQSLCRVHYALGTLGTLDLNKSFRASDS